TIVDEHFDIIPKIVIADFNFVWNPDEQPAYATLQGRTLQINSGVNYAAQGADGADVGSGPADENVVVDVVTLSSSDEMVSRGFYQAGTYYQVSYNGNPDKKLANTPGHPGEKELIPRLFKKSDIDLITGDGGAGNDSFLVKSGVTAALHLRGGSGDDQIVQKGSGRAEFYGDDGNDELRGNGQDDRLDGGSGNDSIFGGDGNDQIFGGDGNDTIFGDKGSDYIEGGAGNDIIAGDTATPLGGTRDASGDGNDVIHGGTGNDAILGQGGNDFLYGEDGDDRISGNDGNDFILGGEGNDNLSGNAGVDALAGGGGNDSIYWTFGDGQDSFIAGGGGDDTYLATTGATGEQISLDAVDNAATSLVFTDPAPTSGVGFPGGNVTLTQSNFGIDLGIDSSDFTLTGFENLVLNTGEGADTVAVGDLANTGLTDVNIDLGA